MPGSPFPTGLNPAYRGRLAPSPTGHLHLGHAATFWRAHERATTAGGTLVLRNEDLDRSRCRPEFSQAMLEDLRWLGCQWQEGPDVGGPFGPYSQSERHEFYAAALRALRDRGVIYVCRCSRKDVLRANQAPHAGEDEPLYPGTCRERGFAAETSQPENVCWRFRVPDGRAIAFIDERQGQVEFVAGRDFGDFVVWRQDRTPAYQLAVVVDDAAMRINEVVRGADLLKSTARQILLYEALELPQPRFYHCPLVTDEEGQRLAKRHDALSLRTLREQGCTPEQVRELGINRASQNSTPATQALR